MNTEKYLHATCKLGLGIGILFGTLMYFGNKPKPATLTYSQGLEQGRAETEPQTGLIKLLVDKKGEALAITGNGDYTTSTNYFGNINDEELMKYVEGEKVPAILVEKLPKIGE